MNNVNEFDYAERMSLALNYLATHHRLSIAQVAYQYQVDAEELEAKDHDAYLRWTASRGYDN